MAARSEAVARQEEEDDDVWNFCNESGEMPLIESEGTSSDESPVKRPAPKGKQSKRRKFKTAQVPDLIILDESSEEQDSDLDVEKELKRKAAKKQESPFDDLNIVVTRQHLPRQPSSAERQVILKAKQSLEQLQQLSAQMDAPGDLPEDEDNDAEDEFSDEDNDDSEKSEEEAEAEEELEEEKIVVKLKWGPNQAPLKLRVGKGIEMERLFERFRTAGLQRELFDDDVELTFMFDGDKIESDQTAEDLDLDDDCVIEVRWS